jgi:hypothetical protein
MFKNKNRTYCRSARIASRQQPCSSCSPFPADEERSRPNRERALHRRRQREGRQPWGAVSRSAALQVPRWQRPRRRYRSRSPGPALSSVCSPSSGGIRASKRISKVSRAGREISRGGPRVRSPARSCGYPTVPRSARRLTRMTTDITAIASSLFAVASRLAGLNSGSGRPHRTTDRQKVSRQSSFRRAAFR